MMRSQIVSRTRPSFMSYCRLHCTHRHQYVPLKLQALTDSKPEPSALKILPIKKSCTHNVNVNKNNSHTHHLRLTPTNLR